MLNSNLRNEDFRNNLGKIYCYVSGYFWSVKWIFLVWKTTALHLVQTKCPHPQEDKII